MQERLVNLQLTFVSDGQPTKVVQPGQSALNYPPMPTQPLTTVDAAPCNSRCYPSLSQRFPALSVVVAFISVQLHRSLASAASSSPKTSFFLRWLDSIHNLHKHIAVVDISAGTHYCERDPLSVDHNMALRSLFPTIRRRRPGSLAPFLAGTLDESTEARVQSIFPASPSLSRSSWCRFSHTPASCQSRRRRQHVIPLPQPISGGNISHGSPALSTKMMPVSAALLGTRGRPPFGLDGSAGRSGSITCHSSLLTIGFAIPDSTQSVRF
jgi:hypothetical protein